MPIRYEWLYKKCLLMIAATTEDRQGLADYT
jgi:hypothetical protein